MNYFDPQIQAELHRQRILEEAEEIQLQNEAMTGKNILSKTLALVGERMILFGEMLRRKNSNPKTHYVELNKKAMHR